MKKKGILREFVLLGIEKSPTRLLGPDVEARLSRQFLCRSIVVAERTGFEKKNQRGKSGGYS